MHKFWMTLCCLALCTLHSAASQAVELFSGQSQVPLSTGIEFIEDRNKKFSLEEILSWDLTWQKHKLETFNKSYSHSAWWLRINTENTSDEPISRLLEIGYPMLDSIDVYLVSDNKVIQSYKMGDKQPYDARPIDHRMFLVPLTWQPSQQADIYLRVVSSSAIQVPLTLWEQEAFYAVDTTRSVMEGLFFGTMIAIAIYNLLIYFALGDRTYLLYVGYVSSLPLLLAAAAGYAFRYVWPQATSWNDQAVVVLLSITTIFGLSFSRHFLQVSSVSNVLDKLLWVAMLGTGIVGVSVFKIDYLLVIVALIIWSTLINLFSFGVGIYCWSKKVTTAKYYCVAWAAMLLGGATLALSKMSIIPSSTMTDYAFHLGVTLEVVLLSFALAERINAERMMRFEAQQQALISTQRTNEDLERRVQQRTQELEKLTEQLKRLSNTDQLTGLNNRRYFDLTLAEEWERNRSYGRHLALILLDIDHFKSVNDTYGHPVGDQCLREVSQLILQGLRWPTDIAARYGGEEFCIILPETDFEGALTVAERIRESIERHTIETNVTNLNITISLGINSCIPSPQSTPEALLEKADEALYAAKEQGRNRTVLANTLRAAG